MSLLCLFLLSFAFHLLLCQLLCSLCSFLTNFQISSKCHPPIFLLLVTLQILPCSSPELSKGRSFKAHWLLLECHYTVSTADVTGSHLIDWQEKKLFREHVVKARMPGILKICSAVQWAIIFQVLQHLRLLMWAISPEHLWWLILQASIRYLPSSNAAVSQFGSLSAYV